MINEAKKGMIFIAAVSAVNFAAILVHAATVSVSATKPAVEGVDQANLVVSTGNETIWPDRSILGNTFTSDPQGGALNSITVQITDDKKILGWKDYVIRVGAVTLGEPNAFYEISSEIGRQTTDIDAGSYVTFTLDTPVELVAHTLYAFQVGLSKSEEDWQSGTPALASGSDTFTGGQYITGGKVDVAPGSSLELQTGDLIFHLGITAGSGSSPSVLLGLGGVNLILRPRK
jgi:hypothetical protein